MHKIMRNLGLLTDDHKLLHLIVLIKRGIIIIISKGYHEIKHL